MAGTGASILSMVQKQLDNVEALQARGPPKFQASITLTETGVIFVFPEELLIYLQKSV